MLLVGHNSSRTLRCLSKSIRLGDSMLLIPCPILVALSFSTAYSTFSAPPASPACTVIPKPPFLAILNASACGWAVYPASSPARSKPTTPCCLNSSAICASCTFTFGSWCLRAETINRHTISYLCSAWRNPSSMLSITCSAVKLVWLWVIGPALISRYTTPCKAASSAAS